jgi:hypothetical protein
MLAKVFMCKWANLFFSCCIKANNAVAPTLATQTVQTTETPQASRAGPWIDLTDPPYPVVAERLRGAIKSPLQKTEAETVDVTDMPSSSLARE